MLTFSYPSSSFPSGCTVLNTLATMFFACCMLLRPSTVFFRSSFSSCVLVFVFLPHAEGGVNMGKEMGGKQVEKGRGGGGGEGCWTNKFIDSQTCRHAHQCLPYTHRHCCPYRQRNDSVPHALFTTLRHTTKPIDTHQITRHRRTKHTHTHTQHSKMQTRRLSGGKLLWLSPTPLLLATTNPASLLHPHRAKMDLSILGPTNTPPISVYVFSCNFHVPRNETRSLSQVF